MGPVRALLAVAVMGGCAPAESGRAMTPPTMSAEAPRRMLLFPGERLEARIDRGGIELAEIHVAFGAPCRDGDALVVPATAHAESAGVAAVVSAGELDSVSWLEASSGLPRWEHVRIDVDKTHADLDVEFDARTYSYRYRREGRPERQRTEVLPEGAEAHDVVSALGAARALADKSEAGLFVLVGRRLWRLELSHQGSDVVSVGGERYDAQRIDGRAWRLMTSTFKPARIPVELSLWLSDDAYRMPLRARLSRRDTTVEIDLVDYQLEPLPHKAPQRCARR